MDTSKPQAGTPQGEVELTLRLSGDEREVLLLALGELLQSVSRDEHLTPTVQRLLERLRSLSAGAK